MAEKDDTLEDIAAGLLNGAMIFLLGAAFPTAFVWMAVTRGVDWSIGLDLDSLVAGSQLLALAIFSFLLLRKGVRMVQTSMTDLRRHRSRSPAA